jgi:hypothetical protein
MSRAPEARRKDMIEPKKPPASEFPETGFRQDTEMKLVNWVRAVAESNNELVHALNRLRVSYKVLLSGESVTDAPEILREVEDALASAAKAKDLS